MGNYTIKDLERLSGVKAHTIRIWEQRYGVLNPSRTQTNIRRYDDSELKLLLNISQLLRHGGKISKLSRLSSEQISRELENVVKSIDNPEDYYSIHVDQLIIAMVEFSEPKFEKVISVTSLKYGFEATMLNVIYPFLHKVGLMWQTGEINVAQEHFISNLIRRKILVAIDGLVPNEKGKRFLLFLPEGELHELGLLFSKYMLKSRGFQVLYLGQSVPLVDLVSATETFKPDGLMTFMTASNTPENIRRYLDALVSTFPNQTLYVAGAQIAHKGLLSHKNLVVLNGAQDFVAHLNKSFS